MKKLTLIAMLLATPAFADEAKPVEVPAAASASTATPAAPAAPAPFVIPQGAFIFVLDNADLNILAAALNELPKKTADPFLMRLQSQSQNQPGIITAIKAK